MYSLFIAFFTSEPLQHFYFWLKPSAGTICWSREETRKKSLEKETRVLQAYEGPSNAFRNSSGYSLNLELYRNVFSVLTDSGVLDLMAYNEQSHQQWLKDIDRLAQRNREDDRLQRNQFEDTSLLPLTGDRNGATPQPSPLTSSIVQSDGIDAGMSDELDEQEQVSLPTEDNGWSGNAWVAQREDEPHNVTGDMDDSCGEKKRSVYRSERPQRTSLQDLFQLSRRSSQVQPFTSPLNEVPMVTTKATPTASELLGHSSLVLLDDVI